MIFLLVIIAVVSALFTSILEKEDLLLRKSKPGYLFSWLSGLLAICAFLLFYNYPNTSFLKISTGVIYLALSLVYIGVWSRHSRLNHFAIHLILVFIMTALSQISWNLAVSFALLFIIAYFLFNFILKKLKSDTKEARENVIQGFELTRVLNGLYLLIIGLALGGDSIHFFWRIADFLF
jgi:hypothetical protein